MTLDAIRQFVDEWCRLKLTLKAPPSPTGRMLELMQLEITGTMDEWKRGDSAKARMAKFAHYEYVMGQLSQLERLVLVASVLPVATVTVDQWVWFADLQPIYTPLYELERGVCNAPTVTGHACRLARLFGEPRCHLHREVASRPVTYVTRDGAEMTGAPYCPPDPDGEPTKWDGRARDASYQPMAEDPARVRVLREKPVYASPEYLADLLGVVVWAVREAGRTGRAKLVELLLEERVEA